LDPIVIFLIDGEANDPRDPVVVVNDMREANSRLQFLTIKFGSEPTDKHLKDMADAGSGKFLVVTVNQVDLTLVFEHLAKTLRPQVTALI
jgi:hypothetical protein